MINIVQLKILFVKGKIYMNNNLYNVEKNLRSIAKRFKSIKYSLGMAILFLMLGVSAFSEEINSVQTREEITTSKNLLRGSVEIYK